MTRVWTKGCDEILAVLEKHRTIQLEISRQAEYLADCTPRETIGFSLAVVQAAAQIPALQRLIERAESIRAEIEADCIDAAKYMEQSIAYCKLLDDKRHLCVIHMFYIQAIPMGDIAKKMHYCTRWCELLRDEAICYMAEKSVRISSHDYVLK